MRDHLLTLSAWPALRAEVEASPRKVREALPRSLYAPDTAPADVIAFEREDWTRWHQESMGAAQAPQSESQRVGGHAPASQPEAAPTQPAGTWRKTTDQKPPKAGEYWSKFDSPDAYKRSWNGSAWLSKDSGDALGVHCNAGISWLDTSPAPDGDGWIKHDGTDLCPVHGDCNVDVVFADGREGRGHQACTWGWGWDGEKVPTGALIVAYRLAKEPA